MNENTSLNPQDDPGNYEHFQQQHSPEPDFRINECLVFLRLLPDPYRASLKYHFWVCNQGESPEIDWFFDIPQPQNKTHVLYVRDNFGDLKYSLLPKNSTTQLNFQFRQPLNKNDEYHFEYEFETQIRPIVISDIFSTTVMIHGWHIFDSPCETLKVNLLLPQRSKILKSVPSLDLEHGSLEYSHSNLKLFEPFSYIFAYRKAQVGVKLLFWIASAIASGIIGRLISIFW